MTSPVAGMIAMVGAIMVIRTVMIGIVEVHGIAA
jgi:hypothetical protein